MSSHIPEAAFQPPILQHPDGWLLVKLSSIADVQLGKTPAKTDYRNDGRLKIVKYRDLGDDGTIKWTRGDKGFVATKRLRSLNLRKLEVGDVLVSASAHSSEIIGRKVLHVHALPDEFEAVYFVGEILCVRTNGEIAPNLSKLLTYFFSSIDGYKSIQSRVHGVHLIASRAEEIIVPFPPKASQARIASKLDELFSRLEEGERALRHARKLVERYRQAVLKSAVTGELTRIWREQRSGRLESGEALLERILDARRAAWEDAEVVKLKAADKLPKSGEWKQRYKEPTTPDFSDLPVLPSGWKWTSLGQLFRVSIGSTPSRKHSEYWNGGIPWVSSGEVAFCRIKQTAETISALGLANSSVKLQPKGTVMLAMIGEGKTRGQAAILDIDACHNQNAASIDVSATPIPPEYIYYFLKFRYEYVRGMGQGGNQPALNGELVKSIAIPLPPLEEIKELCDLLDRQFGAVAALEGDLMAQDLRVTAQRQAILREAFKGLLVSQDATDEPAEVLFESITAVRGITMPTAPRRGRKKKKVS